MFAFNHCLASSIDAKILTLTKAQLFSIDFVKSSGFVYLSEYLRVINLVSLCLYSQVGSSVIGSITGSFQVYFSKGIGCSNFVILHSSKSLNCHSLKNTVSYHPF